MTVRPLTRSAALGLALAALAAPTAGAQQDLRSPDTRDAAQTSQQAPAERPPTERQAFPGLVDQIDDPLSAWPSKHLRSPDTRDAAEGRGTFNSPEVSVIKVPQASPTPDVGLDWGDTGIGAGGMLGLILLGLGAALTISHRRQGPRRQTATSG